MISMLRHVQGGVLLDIGCADKWVRQFIADDCKYLGLDSVMTGQLMYGALPDIFADASRLPLANETVDTVTFFEVLEHLAKPKEALAEIERILRPRGQSLMTLPFLYPIHDAPHDFQRYTEHGLRRELAGVGLEIIEMRAQLSSIEMAGLLGCIALGGGLQQSFRRRHWTLIFSPLLLLLILITNLLAWIAGKILPAWPAMTSGYLIRATKRT